ncbi:anthranilate phosphoribosyltransferase [Neoasaia chiangmaiensis NBRC 101099]|uniref:Anthranilate phosphoribosyltransferase n=2 Tax=Neoasaia chiangmaiensis TaxID=320497 RepID=A0A1U9KNK7_9PROT|nr:anthranilate phosphoribosyltransferase [Neoasaia chiangmaiensis]AQS87343.1 anthranilate phosphoribosyltransferase [Neoasaia chiangmaiensis]GBR43048.1 anthranilate phosphoribosyltransferase [Neoasaia chiangmaiensis NBRC 101099]GEN16102.1 anthranilate phosphoribosyltransferase [Neoasaia chiangmaiensis]
MEEGDLRVLMRDLAGGGILSEDRTEALFSAIMTGALGGVPLASILTAMSVRGETEAELRGAVRAVRSHMLPLAGGDPDAVDVCGTGGDGLGTLNISTAVAFVLAGMGVPVAKHGNRALSSRAGATDVLSALGIVPDEDFERQAYRLREDGLIFMAAPLHHPAMRHAGEVRRALGFRTLFNLIGPLANPAGVRRQMVGVFDARWMDPVARALGGLGSTCVWVVHGDTDMGGSDELTLAGPGRISAWEGGDLRHLAVSADMAGLASRPIAAIAGGDAAHNARMLRDLLAGATGAYRDTVLLNAAVALHVAGRANIVVDNAIAPDRLQANVMQAADAIDSGAALSALERATRSLTDIDRSVPVSSFTMQQSGSL